MQVIAHRGASGTEPENTMPAFDRAFAVGADGIELDVRRCGSGELVVFHDTWIRTNALVKRKIQKLPWSQLQRLSGKAGGDIPLLEEVLDRFAGEGLFFIEVKDAGIGDAVGELAAEYAPPEDVYVISRYHEPLEQVRAVDSALGRGLITGSYTEDLLEAAGSSGLDVVGYRDRPFVGEALQEQHVERADRHGVETCVWTVNREDRAATLAEWGVDYLTTDHPERFT